MTEQVDMRNLEHISMVSEGTSCHALGIVQGMRKFMYTMCVCVCVHACVCKYVFYTSLFGQRLCVCT